MIFINKTNYNEVIISGVINNIKEFNKYILFGLTCNNYSNTNSKCYINLQIYEDLYNKYKDFFIRDNYVYVKGYLNSYTDKDNKIVCYVRATSISNNSDDIINGEKKPHIRYDADGVEVWNGIRCEKKAVDKNSPEYLEMVEIISSFK